MKPVTNEPVEKVYEGVTQYKTACDDMKYIICHACGEHDTCTESYINGDVSIDLLPDVKAFRVPAIKMGTQANKDGYYRLEQLICHIENANLMIEKVERLGDDKIGVFFDVCNKQILCDYISVLENVIRPHEFIIGGVTKTVYLVAVQWNFLVSAKNEKEDVNN